MKKLFLIASLIFSIATRASLELCGVDIKNKNIQKLNSCDEKESSLTPKEQYDCYKSVYEKSMDDLEDSSIHDQSPALRDLLSITRKNFQIGDEPNRLLNFYETTELVRLTRECRNKSVNIYEQQSSDQFSLVQRECLISGEQLDKANEVAIKSQSNHYALFKAGKKLNQLKGLLEPPVKRNFRYELEPTAFKDCRSGILPGAYPPQNYVSHKKQANQNKDHMGCPTWVQHHSNCGPQNSPLSKMNESIIIDELFRLGIETQLKAFSEQLLTKNPKSLTTGYKKKVVTKIESALDQCFRDQTLDGNDTLRGLKLSLLEDSYFDQKGYDAYEQMEAIDTANAIKKLSVLEKYYKKISNKYSKLNKYYYGKCRISHYYPSMGIKRSDECQQINKMLTRFKESFVTPINSEISQIRSQLPFLSIPLSGGEFGSSTCFTGIVDDMASSPISYAIYGKFTPIVKANEFRNASSKLHYDTKCGAPAWKGAADSNHFSHNIDPQSLTPTLVREYGRLIQVSDPTWTTGGKYPEVSTLQDIIEKEFNPNNNNSELKQFEKFMSSYQNQPVPDENEIELAKKVKKEADIGIENALLNTLQDACEDPQDYGKELLINDPIGKLFFAKNNLDSSSKNTYCQARNAFIEEEKKRDRNLSDASIGFGILGFIHPAVALAVLPIEFGLEYAQYSEVQSDKRRNLSLALLGLEDYQKADEEIRTLKSEELMFYGIIGAMALGGVGDVIDGLGNIRKITRRQMRIASGFSESLNNFSPGGKLAAEAFNKKIEIINASGMTPIEKKMAIIDAFNELKKTISKTEFDEIQKVFGNQIESIRKLLTRDIKYDLAKTFATEDLSIFIDDIAKIEDTDELEILMNAYKKSKSSPEEKQKFLSFLKRRAESCGI